MNKMMAWLAALALVLAGGLAQARSDIRDGNALIKPEKNARYSIDGFTMGKAELYGYIGDLRDSQHITGIVLKKGGDDEQRHIIATIAKALGLKSFEQDGRELKELPQPDLPATPPPVEPATDGATAAPASDGAVAAPATAQPVSEPAPQDETGH